MQAPRAFHANCCAGAPPPPVTVVGEMWGWGYEVQCRSCETASRALVLWEHMGQNTCSAESAPFD